MTFLNSEVSLFIRVFFFFHIFSGSIALLVFLIPLLTRKGSKQHIFSGKVYIYSMMTVAFTTLPIALWRILGSAPKQKEFSLFLVFIAILALSSIWQGIRVLKCKERKMRDLSMKNIFLSLLLITMALVSLATGVQTNNHLLTYFSLVGFIAAFSQINYWFQVPLLNKHWLYEHMTSMFTACIATVTAFLVTALPRIIPHLDPSSLIIWLAPTLIFIIILNIWIKIYKNKFEN